MSTDRYQKLLHNIWLFHNVQIWMMRDSKTFDGDYYLNPKWENFWV